jgi:Dna[CI] antecedent, DciA
LGARFIVVFGAMQKPKRVNELLMISSPKLGQLKARLAARRVVLEQVRACLSPSLAKHVVSAGVEQGRLIVGVNGAVWASRLRYLTFDLAQAMAACSSQKIDSVRVKIVL